MNRSSIEATHLEPGLSKIGLGLVCPVGIALNPASNVERSKEIILDPLKNSSETFLQRFARQSLEMWVLVLLSPTPKKY